MLPTKHTISQLVHGHRDVDSVTDRIRSSDGHGLILNINRDLFDFYQHGLITNNTDQSAIRHPSRHLCIQVAYKLA